MAHPDADPTEFSFHIVRFDRSPSRACRPHCEVHLDIPTPAGPPVAQSLSLLQAKLVGLYYDWAIKALATHCSVGGNYECPTFAFKPPGATGGQQSNDVRGCADPC